ncbi:multidrug resistance efflux pump [Lysinibacillus composti]|uniref:HlyD family secretion protein n=1 Tax=Lysinibacillus composti TaxID=720633 RepID=A0A3N9UK37_9BACI|nr:HlyD family efflux transporter periplasmic adaptor subunit [Lysinibacillus composti]MBM7607147.1 multidrug resistance efflux pump [Lysinibacillus composti]RQW76265.1 HlyD family secretion protein [Lysinibacillus composti]
MKKKIILVVLLVLFVVSGGTIGYYYYYQGTHYVKTEDARLAGEQYKVMAQISSKVTSFTVEEGEILAKNEAIAEQDVANIDASMISKSVIRAPIDGTVIKLLNNENDFVAAGTPVALMMNMDELYVTANIEETDIQKIKVGQEVDITVDALDGAPLVGKVRKIGEGSNSVFSLVPAINTSGNFSKVTQLIPIEIAIAKPADMKLIPGTNVVIKIHIK